MNEITMLAQKLPLDEPSQADPVLGDGARGRGALCGQISRDPGTGADVGFIWLELAFRSCPGVCEVSHSWLRAASPLRRLRAFHRCRRPGCPGLGSG